MNNHCINDYKAIDGIAKDFYTLLTENSNEEEYQEYFNILTIVYLFKFHHMNIQNHSLSTPEIREIYTQKGYVTLNEKFAKFDSATFKHYLDNIFEFIDKSGFNLTVPYIFSKSKKSRKYFKRDVKSITLVDILKHFTGDTIALPLYKHTQLVVIDIDRRSQTIEAFKNDLIKIEKEVHALFGESFLTERRIFSKNVEGIHIYYDLTEYLNDISKNNIVKYFKNKGMIVEVKTKGNIMRLPLSYDYNAYLQDGFTESTIYSIKKYINHNKTNIQKNKELNKLIDLGTNIEYTTDLMSKEKSDELYDKVMQNKLEYRAGTRYLKQIQIGFYVKNRFTDASFEDYVKACDEFNDGTSKDMMQPDLKKLKMLQEQWSWIEENYDSDMHGNNNSKDEVDIAVADYNNRHALQYDELSSFTDKEFKKLEYYLNIEYRKQKIGKVGGKFQKSFILDCIIALEWFKTMYDYRKEHKYKYKDSRYSKLEEGVPISDKMLRSMAHEFQLSNIRKIFTFLQDINLLTLLKDSNGYSYSYKIIKHCKHFSLDYLLYIIKSTTKTIYNHINNKFNNNNYYSSYNCLSFGLLLNISNVDNFLYSNLINRYCYRLE